MVRLRILFFFVLCWVLAATASFGQSQAVRDEDFQQLSKQAVRAQREGQGEQAIRLYLKALGIRPTWADGWRNVGMLLADRREYARAEAAFKNLLDIEPKNGAGWALLGLCEYEMRRYEDAYKHLQYGRALGTGNADLETVAAYDAALLLIRKKEFLVAQRILVQMERTGVQDPDLVTAFGLAALCIASTPEKLEARQRDLVNRVGQIEYEAPHAPVPETIAAYERLLAEQPRTPGLHYAFGNFLAHVGHYDQALEEMQKELEITPDDVLTLLQIAMAYLTINQPEKGLPYAEEAVRLSPELFAARYALGWTLFKLGQNDRAIAELERVIKLEPNSPQAHFALSQAYLRAHRKPDADRERETFAKLKQKAVETSGPPGTREYSGTPTENLPSRPEP
jgi:tetratricopeptide (TPR) repeat protein